MSLLFRSSQRALGDSPANLIPQRLNGRGPRVEPGDDQMTSVAWAAVHRRASLISSLPVDVYRKSGGVQVAAPTPTVLRSPGALVVGGPLARIDEWLYATQVDLDRYGNAFGMIVARDAMARPTRIDLVPAAAVSVRTKNGQITYKIGRDEYGEAEIWHERQYVTAGLPVGLSPVAHMAWSLGTYKSAQEFAALWFNAGVMPSAVLKHGTKTLNDTEAERAKARVNATLKAGDVLVVGKDWQFDMVNVPAAQKQFLETMANSASDLARFLDVPGDVIDVAISGQSITYANLTQRNLQLLIMHLGPAIQRREQALSTLTAQPQFVKLNSDALLRMDPAARTAMLAQQVTSRVITPDEWRALENRPPLTDEQVDQFFDLFPVKGVTEPVSPTGDENDDPAGMAAPSDPTNPPAPAA